MDKDVKDLLRWLRARGFRVVRDGIHFRVEHNRVNGAATVPKSPSDHRWYENAKTQLRETFAVLGEDFFQTLPGQGTMPTKSVRDSCVGERVVGLLEDLTGAKGDRPFAGMLEVDRSGRVPVLTIRNPFHSLGSDDDLRSEQFIEVALGRGNQELSWPTIEALKDLGVDLELSTIRDVQRAFLGFAREQRTLMIGEYEARQANAKIAGDAYVGRPSGRVAPEVPGR